MAFCRTCNPSEELARERDQFVQRLVRLSSGPAQTKKPSGAKRKAVDDDLGQPKGGTRSLTKRGKIERKNWHLPKLLPKQPVSVKERAGHPTSRDFNQPNPPLLPQVDEAKSMAGAQMPGHLISEANITSQLVNFDRPVTFTNRNSSGPDRRGRTSSSNDSVHPNSTTSQATDAMDAHVTHTEPVMNHGDRPGRLDLYPVSLAPQNLEYLPNLPEDRVMDDRQRRHSVCLLDSNLYPRWFTAIFDPRSKVSIATRDLLLAVNNCEQLIPWPKKNTYHTPIGPLIPAEFAWIRVHDQSLGISSPYRLKVAAVHSRFSGVDICFGFHALEYLGAQFPEFRKRLQMLCGDPVAELGLPDDDGDQLYGQGTGLIPNTATTMSMSPADSRLQIPTLPSDYGFLASPPQSHVNFDECLIGSPTITLHDTMSCLEDQTLWQSQTLLAEMQSNQTNTNIGAVYCPSQLVSPSAQMTPSNDWNLRDGYVPIAMTTGARPQMQPENQVALAPPLAPEDSQDSS